jgi:hypothetical protein
MSRWPHQTTGHETNCGDGAVAGRLRQKCTQMPGTTQRHIANRRLSEVKPASFILGGRIPLMSRLSRGRRRGSSVPSAHSVARIRVQTTVFMSIF